MGILGEKLLPVLEKETFSNDTCNVFCSPIGVDMISGPSLKSSCGIFAAHLCDVLVYVFMSDELMTISLDTLLVSPSDSPYTTNSGFFMCPYQRIFLVNVEDV